MKVTKIDGLSHKKFEDEGKLVKFEDIDQKNKMKERLEKLKEIKLGNYIKNPDNVRNKDKKAENETKTRRKGLKEYFSEITLRKENEKYVLLKGKKLKEIENYIKDSDIKAKDNQKEIFDVLKRILELNLKANDQEERISFDSNSLKRVFAKEFGKKESQIKAIEKSLEKNKADCKKEIVEIENEKVEIVRGENKRNRIYEYYKNPERRDFFKDNIKEAFKKLYKKEDIKKLGDEILEIISKKHLKSKVRELYRNEIIKKNCDDFSKRNKEGISVLYSQIKDAVEKGEKFKEFEKRIKSKELTKSQIFYKYFLENENLNDENIKNIFCHFVEIEVNDLLKTTIYKADKIYKIKVERIFDYNKLQNLVVNKLENKLDNYIRNCGKYNYHMEIGNIATSDLNMKKRQTEAFLRSIIGVSSFAYFSLRNILKTENKNDITLKFEGEIDKVYEDGRECIVKNNVKMFYGIDIDMDDKKKVKDFFNNIKEVIVSIRNNIVHYKMDINSQNIFSFSEIEPSELTRDIFKREIDERKLKLKVFRQLNSAGVFDYWKDEIIKKYLENVKIKFTNKNIPFVPAFSKLYNRIENLKGDNALKLGQNIIIPKRKEAKDSQLYLLKNIYYGEFVEKFVNDNENFVEIVKEIIEINKTVGTNEKTKFYKLEKFETLSAETPTKYLEKLQSLHKINYDKEKVEESKDVYVDFVQKIFLKGFIKYLQNSNTLRSLNLLKLDKDEVITAKKSFYDEELKKWEKPGSNLSELPTYIDEFVKKVKIDEIKYSDRMSIFYLLLKLLNHKELTSLRGNLEKYESMNKNNIYEEELKIINLVSLDNNKVQTNFELEADEVGKFLNTATPIKKITQLKDFSGIYADEQNVIKHRSFYNLKKYSVLDLIAEIVDKGNAKIKKEEIEEYKNLQNELEKKDFYKIQENIHKKYNKNPVTIKNPQNKKDLEDYDNAIRKIEEYTQMKNKLEFNDLNLLQSIMFRILHRMAGYTSIWERDLQFKLRGEYPEKSTEISEMFTGRIIDNYKNFIKPLKEINKSLKKPTESERKNKKGMYIRNYIAHFNYIPYAELSILEMLERLRALLSYDRKLKNAVMKSVTDILKEYGFEVEFKISHPEEINQNNNEIVETIEVKKVESVKIEHLKNTKFKKDKKLITKKNSEELCKLVKVMLEYKKPE